LTDEELRAETSLNLFINVLPKLSFFSLHTSISIFEQQMSDYFVHILSLYIGK
jgi:hypothetical protein